MADLRIDAVELFHLRMPLRAPFETSFGRETDRDCLLIRLQARGLEAWGECVADRHPGYCYETVGTAWLMLSELMIPAVLGRSIGDRDGLLAALPPFRGHPLARAGLEMAFWDLWGQAAGRPLASLLGGERAAVPVGVSVGIQADAQALRQTVADYVAQGYGRVKLKIKPGRDRDDVQAVREAFPDLALQVDANSAYRLDQAGALEALDAFGLLLIEQPLAEDDLVDHAQLQRRLRTPLCLDESILSARHARQALDLAACRIVNIKAGRVGGLGEAVAIHDLCRARGAPVWCGGMLETGVGRASNLALASLAGFTLPGDISATERYYERDIAEPAFALNPDSTIDVPSAPGLGVRVIPEALARVTLRRERFQA